MARAGFADAAVTTGLAVDIRAVIASIARVFRADGLARTTAFRPPRLASYSALSATEMIFWPV